MSPSPFSPLYPFLLYAGWEARQIRTAPFASRSINVVLISSWLTAPNQRLINNTYTSPSLPHLTAEKDLSKTTSLLPPESRQKELNRQLRIPPFSQPNPIHHQPNIRSNNRHVAREAGDGAQKIPKQYHDTVQLDEEPDQRPPEEDEREPAEEGRGAFELLAACEEEGCFVRADDDG